MKHHHKLGRLLYITLYNYAPIFSDTKPNLPEMRMLRCLLKKECWRCQPWLTAAKKPWDSSRTLCNDHLSFQNLKQHKTQPIFDSPCKPSFIVHHRIGKSIRKFIRLEKNHSGHVMHQQTGAIIGIIWVHHGSPSKVVHWHESSKFCPTPNCHDFSLRTWHKHCEGWSYCWNLVGGLKPSHIRVISTIPTIYI